MITIYSNEEFNAKFKDTLQQNESCQQLIIGNLNHVLESPKEDTLFGVITVESNQYFVCYFPPYSILVTCFPGIVENELCEKQVGIELASYLELHSISVRGINAPRFISEGFNEYYSKLNKSMRKNIDMDVMELRSVNEIPTLGNLEKAVISDIDLLSEYYINFCMEALGDAPSLEDAKNRLMGHIEKKVLYVLKVEDTVVSMCTSARKLGKGCSINAVYTVPKHRGKGYCKSLMAQVCELLLKDGNQYICLYVDQANPISNAAYEKVGFKIVGSSCEYLFEERI